VVTPAQPLAVVVPRDSERETSEPNG